MVEKRVFGDYGVRFTFKCEEGDMTIGTINQVGGDVTGPVFESPIQDGMYVKLTDDLTIEPIEDGDTDILGIVRGTPQFIGRQPTAPAASGDYEPRRVTVECMGCKVDMVPLEEDNSEITPGDSVAPGATTPGLFDVAGAANPTLALVGAAQDSGDSIPVLFGYYGAL